MAKEVYIAAVGLTKVDLTGRIFASVFDLFAEAYQKALEDSAVRSFGAVDCAAAGIEASRHEAVATKATNNDFSCRETTRASFRKFR